MILDANHPVDSKVFQLFTNYIDAYDYLTLSDPSTDLLKRINVSFSVQKGFLFSKALTHINENPNQFYGLSSVYLTCKKYSDEIIEIKLGRTVTFTIGDILVHGE